MLEHLVDCVLFFEGERERSYRTLRALKNRFGATSEVGVFEMRVGRPGRGRGPLGAVRRRGQRRRPGSVVLCAMEGTRPLLVEVQALVAPTEVVPPRRIANGIDRNRLAMILAVLARHGGAVARVADVFVNVAGGVRVDEPGADLAVALAVASAHRGEPLLEPKGRPLACFGEVGLTGELRYVAHAERRVAEALKFGLGPVARARRDRAPRGPRPALDTAVRARDQIGDCVRRPEPSPPADAASSRWPRASQGTSIQAGAEHFARHALTSVIPSVPLGISALSRVFCHHRLAAIDEAAWRWLPRMSCTSLRRARTHAC